MTSRRAQSDARRPHISYCHGPGKLIWVTAKEIFFEQCGKVSRWVFEITQTYDGSVSAEHGVGMTKKPYLEYSRSAEELAYMLEHLGSNANQVVVLENASQLKCL